jgi:hypothetical protein
MMGRLLLPGQEAAICGACRDLCPEREDWTNGCSAFPVPNLPR